MLEPSTVFEWMHGPQAVVPACGVMILVMGTYFLLSRRANDAHKRGTQVLQGRAAYHEKARLRKRAGNALTLAGIAVTPEDEVKHFKLIGTTGTGKST